MEKDVNIIIRCHVDNRSFSRSSVSKTFQGSKLSKNNYNNNNNNITGRTICA